MDPIAGRQGSTAPMTTRFRSDGLSRMSNQGGLYMTGKGRRSHAVAKLVLTIVLFAGLAFASAQAQPRHSPASDRAQAIQRGMMLAQAGSTGGSIVAPESIGKKGKSISSSPAASRRGAAAPVGGEAAKPIKPRRMARPKSRASRCPNISGVWSSWASGIMGKNDTTFGRDGTASHRSGIRGKWWCADGQLHIEWPDGLPGVVTLSDDRRTIFSRDGGVHMQRE